MCSIIQGRAHRLLCTRKLQALLDVPEIMSPEITSLTFTDNELLVLRGLAEGGFVSLSEDTAMDVAGVYGSRLYTSTVVVIQSQPRGISRKECSILEFSG